MGLIDALRVPGTERVHQVGIVVDDLERAIARHSLLLGIDPSEWRRQTFGPESVERMTLRGAEAAYSMRVAFVGDRPEVELIEPLDGPSIYHEWLQASGEGLHHLAFVVASLDAAVTALEAAGYPLLESGHGFAPDGRGGFAYFETTGALGYVLEAVELPHTG